MHYIQKEWKENVRSKGLWFSLAVVIALSIGILLKSTALSFDQGIYVLLLNLFESFVYLLSILSIFIGAFSIFQEKEQKTLVMLLTRQDTFMSFYLKKMAAVISVLAIPLLLWLLVFLVPIKFYFQLDVRSYMSFLLAVMLMVITFTFIGLMIGSILASRMQVIGVAVVTWFYFFFIHDFVLLSFLSKVSYENVKLFSTLYFLNPIPAARMHLESAIGVYSYGHMSKLLQSFLWLKPYQFLLLNTLFFAVVTTIVAVLFSRKESSQ